MPMWAATFSKTQFRGRLSPRARVAEKPIMGTLWPWLRLRNELAPRLCDSPPNWAETFSHFYLIIEVMKLAEVTNFSSDTIDPEFGSRGR